MAVVGYFEAASLPVRAYVVLGAVLGVVDRDGCAAAVAAIFRNGGRSGRQGKDDGKQRFEMHFDICCASPCVCVYKCVYVCVCTTEPMRLTLRFYKC